VKRRGRCDEAAPLLAMAATMAPSESRYAVHFGRCLVELGDYAEALRVAERGRAQFRDTRVEPAFLVIEVLARRDPRAATPLLARCIALDPKRTDCIELQQQNERYLRHGDAQLPSK
jgi:thioredoxin-like negative regulator of GroEL